MNDHGRGVRPNPDTEGPAGPLERDVQRPEVFSVTAEPDDVREYYRWMNVVVSPQVEYAVRRRKIGPSMVAPEAFRAHRWETLDGNPPLSLNTSGRTCAPQESPADNMFAGGW